MLTLVYLLFYGYPSDQVVIPIIAVLTIIGIRIAITEIKKDLRGDV